MSRGAGAEVLWSIVLVVMAVVALGGCGDVQQAREAQEGISQAKTNQCRIEIKLVRTAADAYRQEQGTYPRSIAELVAANWLTTAPKLVTIDGTPDELHLAWTTAGQAQSECDAVTQQLNP